MKQARNYDRNSNMPVDRTTREILIAMYNPPRSGEDFHFLGTSTPDELKTKIPEPWTAVLLAGEIGKHHNVSLPLVRNALIILYKSELIDMRGREQGDSTGYDLNPAGEREAVRLGAKADQ
jgi:hypothetical protein